MEMVSIRLRRGSALLLAAVMLLSVTAQSAPARAATSPSYKLVVDSAASAQTVPLDGATVKGYLRIDVTPTKNVKRVEFYIDNTERIGSPDKTDGSSPYRLGIAKSDLSDGTHTVTAVVRMRSGGSKTVTARFTVNNGVAPLLSTSTILHGGNALHGQTVEAGALDVELSTTQAVDGVRFRVNNIDGPFVRPAGGKIAATVTIEQHGIHTVSAVVFRNREVVEEVEATITVPDPDAPVAPVISPSTIVHSGNGLHGQTVEAGPLDVELSTTQAVDGVRFRLNNIDGPFVRPVDGKIAALITANEPGTHTISADVFRNREVVDKAEATFTVAGATAPIAPDPAPATEPVPVLDGERLGLHVTAGELAIWRQRATSGPYKSKGDESLNSPGDWDRITANANVFMKDPDAGRWAGPVANTPGGCVQKVNDAATDPLYVPSWRAATNLRDAAFVALVTDDKTYAAQVKSELVAQAKVTGVDFGNRNRYCLGSIVGDENPMFNIANWVTRLQFAYDYLQIQNPNLFTSTEKALLESWFKDAAVWMQYAVDIKLDQLFVNRPNGDYTLTSTAQNDWSRQLYQGGPYARTLQRRYNNRAATAVRFLTLVGVDQGNASLIKTGENYVTELLQFGYYPQGVVGEFERWTSTDGAKGWKYAAEQLGSVITIADTLARAGDTTLYRYSTTNGALGTAGLHHSGQPKSIRTLVRDLYNYVDGTYKRKTPAGLLIDPAGDGWIHDTMLTMSNVYYKDDYFKSIYTRTAAPAYPAKPNKSQGDPEGGEWGIYPGMLFMFGQTEGDVRPYSG